MEKVEIRIKRDGSGKVKFDCNGFKGEGCSIIEQLENMMLSQSKTEDKAERHLYENPDPVFNELG